MLNEFRHDPHKTFIKRRGKVAALSLTQTILQYLFFYIGLANTSGVKSSVIEGMSVFVSPWTTSTW